MESVSALASSVNLFTLSLSKTSDNGDDVNATAGISSSLAPLSSAPRGVNVALSTVTVYFLLLTSLLSLGVAANVAVVVAARWPIRSHHFWRRLAIANLCVVQLFVCVLVTPVVMTSALLGFFRHHLQAEFCSASFFFLHGGLAATVACLVVVAGVRWRELEFVCSGESQQVTGSQAMTVCIVVGPWIFGAVLGTLTFVDVHGSMAFFVCCDALFGEATPTTTGGSAWRIKPSLAVVYVASMSLVVVALAVVYRYHSRRLQRLLESWRERSEQTILLHGGNPKKKKSKPGGQTVKLSPLEMDRRRPMNLTVDGKANDLCPSPEDAEEIEGTEDTFDMKMRLKFQKKPRASERRHTVANICLPDLGNHRRRSLENGKGKPSSPANDYQYVRKWSVDITALANQLENPKLHTSSYPTLRNTSPGSGSTCGEPGKETDGPAAGEATCGASTKGSVVLLLPGITKGTASPLARLAENRVTDTYVNLETPSIVVSLTPDTEADTLDDSFETRSRLDSEISGDNTRDLSLPLETTVSTPDDKGVTAAREELSEVLRTTIMMIASLLFLLPLTVSDLLEPLIRKTLGLSVDFNLDLIVGALCLVQGVTIPLLLIWSNRDIREQLIAIKGLLRNLRCVCTCNLGPGRSCSIRKRRREKRQPKV